MVLVEGLEEQEAEAVDSGLGVGNGGLWCGQRRLWRGRGSAAREISECAVGMARMHQSRFFDQNASSSPDSLPDTF